MKDLMLVTLWEKYLHTSQQILKELIDTGNPRINEYQDLDSYYDNTRWSDFHVAIPTLFLFFHGIELIMKWVLVKLWEQSDRTHTLTIKINHLIEYLSDTSKLVKVLKKYIYITDETNSTLKYFLENYRDNASPNIDKFYIFLRYPFDNNEEYDYLPIKYREIDFLWLACELVSDIDIIMKESQKIFDK